MHCVKIARVRGELSVQSILVFLQVGSTASIRPVRKKGIYIRVPCEERTGSSSVRGEDWVLCTKAMEESGDTPLRRKFMR